MASQSVFGFTISPMRPVARLSATSLAAIRGFTLTVHTILTVIMAWFGLILLLPFPTFGNSPAYTWFVNHWPNTETGWGIAFLTVATIGAVGLRCRNRWARLLSGAVLSSTFGIIAQAIASGFPGSTGTGTYGTLALFGVLRVLAEAVL